MDDFAPVVVEPKPKTYTGLLISILFSLAAALTFFAWENGRLKEQLLQSQVIPESVLPGPSTDPQAEVATPASGFNLNKMFASSDEFPLTFNYPENIFLTTKNLGGQSFHIFISSFEVVVPEQWDAPLAPVEIVFVYNHAINYQDQVNGAVSVMSPGAVTVSELLLNGLKTAKISGAIGTGFLEGEQIDYYVIETEAGIVTFEYFKTLFTGEQPLMPDVVEAIVNSLKLL